MFKNIQYYQRVILIGFAWLCLGATPQQAFAAYKQISSGGYHTCGLKTDGGTTCWGAGKIDLGVANYSYDNGQSITPNGTFTQLSAGYAHTCGLKTDGGTTCWGLNNYGQTTIPTNNVFTQLSAGGGHTCGLKTDGGITCWGAGKININNGEYGQSIVPNDTLTQVSAGYVHTCGLKDDGGIICWGRNFYGESDAPNGIFIQVSAGESHSCGLKNDGSLVCWGAGKTNTGDYPEYGQSVIPSGIFTQVSAGSYHTCGLKNDGRAICWGRNDNGRSAAPNGIFTQLSAGNMHTCGLKSDSNVICWGRNIEGQSTPPVENCSYSISPLSRNHSANSETGSVSVSNNNCSWTAQPNVSWINISSTSNSVNYTVQANTTTTDRSGTITIAGQTFTINQVGRKTPIASFTATPNSTNAPSTVILDSSASRDPDGSIVNYDWKVNGQPANIQTSGNQKTLVFTNAGTYNIVLTVTDNDGLTHQTQQTVVVQSCSYSIDPTNRNHNANAENGSIAVSVSNGCNFTAQSNVSWISITSQTTNAVNYSIQSNTTTNARSGTISIANQTFIINQSSNQPPIANFTIPSTTNPNANVLVDASSSSDNDGSIVEYKWSTSDGQSALGKTATLVFSKVGSNLVTLTVKDNSGATASKDQSITVTKLDCIFSLNATVSPLLKANGESGNFIVTPNLSDCSWSAISSETWITFSNSNGTGSGKVDYTILPNPDTKERSGTILVNNQTFTVKQAGKTPISPIAQFTATPEMGLPPFTPQLDASQSNDPDGGKIEKYEWFAIKEDDPKITLSASGVNSSLTFDEKGAYLLTLKITDDENQTAEITQKIIANDAYVSLVSNQDHFRAGEHIKVTLADRVDANRVKRTDLWAGIQFPDGTIFLKTSNVINEFRAYNPPNENGRAFIPNVERMNDEFPMLDLLLPLGLSGKFIFYAVHVDLGKNPFLDPWRSNLAIKEITLE